MVVQYWYEMTSCSTIRASPFWQCELSPHRVPLYVCIYMEFVCESVMPSLCPVHSRPIQNPLSNTPYMAFLCLSLLICLSTCYLDGNNNFFGNVCNYLTTCNKAISV